MCGIYGYTGGNTASQITIEGLKRIEYRGYDSSGIALVPDTMAKEGLAIIKSVGNLTALEEKIRNSYPQVLSADSVYKLAIGHTRWATHGAPVECNAHPFIDYTKRILLAHNGIIENYLELKELLHEKLRSKDLPLPSYTSETDSEILAHFLGYLLSTGEIESEVEGGIPPLVMAVAQLLPLLRGSWALVIVDLFHPDQIVALASQLPLALAAISSTNQLQLDTHWQCGAVVSSDPYALSHLVSECHFIKEQEIALLKRQEVILYHISKSAPTLTHCPLKLETLNCRYITADKGSYETYTLKEIYEQGPVLSRLIQADLFAEEEKLSLFLQRMAPIQYITIIGCGSAYNAGVAAGYFFEEFTGITTHVEAASEARYRNKPLPSGTLAIAISQSGETADTLSAVHALKNRNIPILAVCNVQESTLARCADALLPIHAGQEIGVCSTKAFTAQVVALYLLALHLRKSSMPLPTGFPSLCSGLNKLPDIAYQVLTLRPQIAKIATAYYQSNSFFFIGRQYMYIAALEGALKLKELSYINCSAYPAGELKHGPLALIDASRPTIALCTHRRTAQKMASNMMEIKARQGKIIAFGFEEDRHLFAMADSYVPLPLTDDPLALIPTSIALQLLACEIAALRGCNIDQPRNLAKSITVE
jgi:glucosamine--fructose-6-phosphate aminotransferase (isomerizing)